MNPNPNLYLKTIPLNKYLNFSVQFGTSGPKMDHYEKFVQFKSNRYLKVIWPKISENHNKIFSSILQNFEKSIPIPTPKFWKIDHNLKILENRYNLA